MTKDRTESTSPAAKPETSPDSPEAASEEAFSGTKFVPVEKGATVTVNAPGPTGSVPLTVTGDGYQAQDEIEEAALAANPLVKGK